MQFEAKVCLIRWLNGKMSRVNIMIQKAYRKFISDFKKLPERKQYIEVFTAILTVPVLLTVIILNVSNLREKDKAEAPKQEPTVREIIITQPSGRDDQTRTVTVSTEPCKTGIGEISIDYPEEDDVVTDNPVQFDINYRPGDFCAVVWSYRINGGRWSDYDDRSVALYNLPQGEVKFDLRVKSVVSGGEESLTRNFEYRGTSTITGPTTPQASGSAN